MTENSHYNEFDWSQIHNPPMGDVPFSHLHQFPKASNPQLNVLLSNDLMQYWHFKESQEKEEIWFEEFIEDVNAMHENEINVVSSSLSENQMMEETNSFIQADSNAVVQIENISEDLNHSIEQSYSLDNEFVDDQIIHEEITDQANDQNFHSDEVISNDKNILEEAAIESSEPDAIGEVSSLKAKGTPTEDINEIDEKIIQSIKSSYDTVSQVKNENINQDIENINSEKEEGTFITDEQVESEIIDEKNHVQVQESTDRLSEGEIPDAKIQGIEAPHAISTLDDEIEILENTITPLIVHSEVQAINQEIGSAHMTDVEALNQQSDLIAPIKPIKEKKPRKPKKKKEEINPIIENIEQDQIQSIEKPFLHEEDVFIPEKKPKKKKKKNRNPFVLNNTSNLNDFNLWLLNLRPLESSNTPKIFKFEKNRIKNNKKTVVRNIISDSVRKNNKHISESLAKILLAQGHFEEAIDMYKQLILNIPEKSGYFAALIDKIQKNNI